MYQEYPVSLVKLSFIFIQVKIIQVLDLHKWHPLKKKALNWVRVRNMGLLFI